MDWNTEAKEAAEYIRTHMFEVDRGAMEWRQPGVCVAFGTDGRCQYPPCDNLDYEWVSTYKENFEQICHGHGNGSLGSGISSDGCTWAVLLPGWNSGNLFNIVWEAWADICFPDGITREDEGFDDVGRTKAWRLIEIYNPAEQKRRRREHVVRSMRDAFDAEELAELEDIVLSQTRGTAASI